ncbi:hypothetical protein CcaverHIS002_0506460 [Cutaneotrichosporon cavernicola]|uniref:GATA-type domain-containing protein n=1 Tax=Cutaneotrichosporon cavernicola TaxID=279322 RepID=A0AA48L6Z5_9TREE|nr:uncharacterized protein CcaverHIS019_0506980 [Cutaneotrichosporon cavernicola]BEI85245.1 hypothetical protein CcaverHIS002_0506460 [Cutaneotrichosporon cavernicola]BEI93070.1 hypothetical protein CcaverHIS019_0506980 [Cutaneotrichosporon cavernicola]BEJ00847.1 hypothetical protein CcaverHIS631_0507040 [Cutaneotrichosporon cavernicola]BEJ08614.1 hypothetical protein CcaverHIS641_0507080 [Cutaneotrichosporon cavernicola]
MDGSGAQRNGVQDEWNPVNVPPLPSHVEANIFASNAPWPFGSVELDQAADRNGGGPVVAESASGSEHKQPSDAGQPTSSPPIPPHTIAKPTPSTQNNADPSPANSQLNLPDMVDFGFTPSTNTAMYDPLPVALPSQMAPPTDPLLIGQPQEGWSLVVEPDTFLSGLEGISTLPLNKYHATATSTTGMPESLADLRRAGNLTYENEMNLLSTYLGEIIRYLEPFAASRENPTPTHPPPFLHTRILRLAVIVRNCIRDLEKSSQPCLDATFRHAPPGVEQTEADKEMAAIRDRRQELMKKQDVKLKQTNNNGMPSSVGPNRLPPPRPGVNMGSGPPRPYIHTGPRDVYRCAGCNTTQSLEWLTGPDGSQSLCHSCGHQYEVLNHARQGDPDFSTIPVPGHNSNLVGLRPN